MIPPDNLLFPVLPVKMHGKLLFILCKSCALTNSQISCNHSDDDRMISGVWVADEIRKSLEMGYTMVTIYEIWEYNVEKYCAASNTSGLFTGYINSYLKLKVEASGWPIQCIDDRTKDIYIDQFNEKEGILLDKSKIASNPALRFHAKTCLNSFWGKFGQRENMSKVVLVHSYEELLKYLTDTDISVESYIVINDMTLLVSYKQTTENITPLNHVSVPIAAYTTAGARLELYKYLEMLGKRVLYFDTDSIIFTQKEGEENPVTGDFLGMLTNELDPYGAGSFIQEYVSAGPKNYAIKIFSPADNTVNFVCKVKGITLNYLNSRQVNFNTIRRIVTQNNDEKIKITDQRIFKTADSFVFTTSRDKTYRMCYTKRRRVSEFETVPFGCKD